MLSTIIQLQIMLVMDTDLEFVKYVKQINIKLNAIIVISMLPVDLFVHRALSKLNKLQNLLTLNETNNLTRKNKLLTYIDLVLLILLMVK